MKQPLILLSVIILSFQCNTASTVDKQPLVDSATTTIISTQQPGSAANTPGRVLHKHIDSAVVIKDTSVIELGKFTFSYGNSSAKELKDDPACTKWKLDAGLIVKIMRSFRPIDGITWDLAFNNLPCELEGEVKISGVPYKMNINAGSYFMLTTVDTTYIFADNNDKFLKYFLSGAYRGE